MKDKEIILASSLIAMENRPGLKIKILCDYVYALSGDIGMTRFSRHYFDQIFIHFALPVLTKAGLIQTAKNGINLTYEDIGGIDSDTTCRLTDTTSKKIKKIRSGSRVRSRDKCQKQVFDNIYTIINGHIDETHELESFKRHLRKSIDIPVF